MRKTLIRSIGLGLLVWAGSVHAQEPESPPAASDVLPSSPDVETPPPTASTTQIPEPPAGYASAADAPEPGQAHTTSAAGPGASSDSEARRYVGIWLGLGFGDAVGCGNEDPDSPCAVDGAAAFTLAADYRLDPHFSIGLELSAWGFAVSEAWLGQLDGEQASAQIGASYLALFGRWYWFDEGIVDPYVQAGLGLGTLSASVTNVAGDTYSYKSSGAAWQLGAGVDFHVSRLVRLGPQFLAALLVGNEVCEKLSGSREVCREPEKNDKGEQEGNALAWRFMLVGTIMLGDR